MAKQNWAYFLSFQALYQSLSTKTVLDLFKLFFYATRMFNIEQGIIGAYTVLRKLSYMTFSGAKRKEKSFFTFSQQKIDV